MHDDTVRPLYSEPWFGRRFMFINCALRWGQYEIVDVDFARIFEKTMQNFQAQFESIQPGKIATVFEDLIHIYTPRALPNYLLEVDALSTLELANLHLSAVKAQNCVNLYVSAEAAVAAAFEATFCAVVRAALTLHEFHDLSFVRCSPLLDGRYLVDFSGDNLIYQVTFTNDIIVERVDKPSILN